MGIVKVWGLLFLNVLTENILQANLLQNILFMLSITYTAIRIYKELKPVKNKSNAKTADHSKPDSLQQ
ncbi:hypothetical protein EFA69_16250 [Rufibacter immobilis]|uniref:Uncharacterized protein n=2 Tax=Rufibacter immobilis TaxID=1348778 RepID=A0A3M9MQ81_9BACT|nr:hypothetical protein EFA69_16250 [Rufibacter immobilis]